MWTNWAPRWLNPKWGEDWRYTGSSSPPTSSNLDLKKTDWGKYSPGRFKCHQEDSFLEQKSKRFKSREHLRTRANWPRNDTWKSYCSDSPVSVKCIWKSIQLSRHKKKRSEEIAPTYSRLAVNAHRECVKMQLSVGRAGRAAIKRVWNIWLKTGEWKTAEGLSSARRTAV